MGDLQLGLLVIGALAVVGVLGYNWRQERSARRQAQRAFGAEPADVLIDGRREPTLEPRRPEPRPGAAPDERVDYVMEVALASAGVPVRELWEPIEHRFARRVLLAIDGTRLRAALQLVSRNGVVPDAELVEFRSLVETMAAKLGGAVRAPEMRPALDAARELDRACADADVQVALHVVGITPGEVEGAEHFQVTPRDDGVTLTLDVARTPEPSRTYEAMARAGRQLAQRAGGRLVDDTGRELDERALASVGAQLEAVRQLLLSRGIEPGSPLALRLFS